MIVPDYILDLVKDLDISNKRSFGRKLSRVLDDAAKKWLSENDITVRQLRWLIENKAESIPVCPVCGGKVAYERGKKWCSVLCVGKSEEIKKKRIQTSIEKYGVENPMQCEEIRLRGEQTCLEKYGVKNAFQAEEIKKKIVDTHIKNLGVEWPMQSKEILEKSKETCLEKYGCKWSLQSKEVREKGKETLLVRYGVDVPAKSSVIQDKMKQTCLKKYGVEVASSCENIRNKMKQSCIEKYGTEYSMQNKEIAKRSIKNRRINRLDKFLDQLEESQLKSLSDVDDLVSGRNWQCQCIKCGDVFETQGMNIQTIFCRNCSKKRSSLAESDFAYIISKLSSYEVKRNAYNIIGRRKEIDVFIPDIKLGFEYNGSYWHSSKFAMKFRHQQKVLDAIDKDIHLITIFDWQWYSQRKLVENTLKRILNVEITHIDGSLCNIVSMDINDFTTFCKNNSLKQPLMCEEVFSIQFNNKVVGVIGKTKNTITYVEESIGIKIDNIITLLNKFNFSSIILDLAIDNVNYWLRNEYIIKTILEPQKYIINNKTMNEAKEEEIKTDRCFNVYGCGYMELTL